MRPASGGMPADTTAAWRPTLAHFRVVFASIVMVVGAVLWRRPDLLVLVAPLVIVSAWSVVSRPSQAPSFTSQLTDSTVREGGATTWHGTFDSADAIDSGGATARSNGSPSRRTVRGVRSVGRTAPNQRS